MDWRRIREYLLPGAAEQDEGFRREIQRLSHLGLRVIGGVMIGVSLFLTLARFLVAPDPGTLGLRLAEGGAVVLLGLGVLSLARLEWTQRRARWLGLVAGSTAGAVLIWFSLCMCEVTVAADDFIPGQLTLIMLVGVAALPLRPMQTLAFGFSLISIYYVSAAIAENIGVTNNGGPQPTYLLFVMTLTLLSTGLTGVVYAQRTLNYQTHLSALRSAEDVRQAERRVLLSQYAASVGRLAAALSHELNSPIGALKSGVDTLLLLSARQATSPPTDHQRLVTVQNEVRKSIQDSVRRLQDIVGRMQRITNLDKAEVQQVNLNELLNDVTGLLDPSEKGTAALELDLREIPPVVCRPRQLSAVFSNLLSNALHAVVNGDGRVLVTSRPMDSLVEVCIQDNGHGVSETELSGIFDPGFRVYEGRVATGNWSLFSSRQVVREHGGDIRIASKPGEGTSVYVTLPVRAQGLT